MRILIVRQNEKLGDTILSTPLFEALKATYPDCSITYWAGTGNASALWNNPFLDELREVPYRPRASDFSDLYFSMRRGQFDAVLLLRYDSSVYAAIARLAGIPKIVGCTNKFYGRWMTDNIGNEQFGPDQMDLSNDSSAPCHIVTWQARLGSKLGKPLSDDYPLRMYCSKEDEDYARSLVAEPYFILHPFTGGSSKSWSLENWSKVAEALSKQLGLRPVISGSKAEASNLPSDLFSGAVIAAGKTNVRQMVALTSGASLVVSGATAAAHFAAAQSVPAVMTEMIPPADIRISQWRPWKSPHRVVVTDATCEGCAAWRCHREGQKCLDGIRPEAVIDAALDLMAEVGGGKPAKSIPETSR